MRHVQTTAAATPIQDVNFSGHPATPRGLYARWQMVDGKLTCQWLRNPD